MTISALGKPKERALLSFLLPLAAAALLFLPFLIYDKGYFIYYGDFNVQQIPFYQMAHDSVRSGNIFWSWTTDLGANFVGSYSFYLLGSPFFWLTLPFPSAAVPYLMGPLLILKFACSSAAAYALLRRFVRPDYALIGGILYAFSGFSIYNVFFNHFHEAIIYFPLMLLGLERFMKDDKRGLFGLMVVGLVLGQELAFVLGGAGVIVGWLAWGTPGVTIAMTKIYDQMQSYSMVAIPMFVLMANFLTHSKVADGLFESIRYLLGPLKGGLGLAVILVSTVFAATTGIVGASVVTMGMLSLPVLLRSGYKPSLACGMVCAGGSLGILIPPSIMLVSMGSYAEVSVGKIFFAAIVPGLSLSLGYIIYLMVVCHIHPDWGPAMSPEELAEMPLKKRITGSLINLIPPLILIFGVLGSIFGGIATPTEAAGIGALFSLILAIFYKQFSWKMLYESLIDTAKTTAMVFIILFGAAAFTGVFMSLDGDQIIADWVLSMGIGKWGAFAIMMVIMFLLGMFIDWLGIVMIVFPIFLPIMDTFGFDRLWLVAVSATLLQTCFMTPPFGFALFYVKGILPPSIKIQEVYRGVIPFIIIICIVTALCAVFPPLVTWLPSMLAS